MRGKLRKGKKAKKPQQISFTDIETAKKMVSAVHDESKPNIMAELLSDAYRNSFVKEHTESDQPETMSDEYSADQEAAVMSDSEAMQSDVLTDATADTESEKTEYTAEETAESEPEETDDTADVLSEEYVQKSVEETAEIPEEFKEEPAESETEVINDTAEVLYEESIQEEAAEETADISDEFKEDESVESETEVINDTAEVLNEESVKEEAVQETADISEEFKEDEPVESEPEETDDTAEVLNEESVQEEAVEETAEADITITDEELYKMETSSRSSEMEENINADEIVLKDVTADLAQEPPVEEQRPLETEEIVHEDIPELKEALVRTPVNKTVKAEKEAAAPVEKEPVVPVKHGYWIHDKKFAPESVKGFFYLSACTCSNCGYRVNTERSICPGCKSQMDAPVFKL